MDLVGQSGTRGPPRQWLCKYFPSRQQNTSDFGRFFSKCVTAHWFSQWIVQRDSLTSSSSNSCHHQYQSAEHGLCCFPGCN